jgi:hypothetical protein
VLVVDPRTGVVRHYRAGQQVVEIRGPISVDLACGCQVQV